MPEQQRRACQDGGAPNNRCRTTFSRNTTQAMPSSPDPPGFSNSDAAAALVRARPNIKSSGPRSRQIRSNRARVNLTLATTLRSQARRAHHAAGLHCQGPDPHRCTAVPAIINGSTVPSRSLANGVRAPNSTAEVMPSRTSARSGYAREPTRSATSPSCSRRWVCSVRAQAGLM
jgi:hypothetical protein